MMKTFTLPGFIDNGIVNPEHGTPCTINARESKPQDAGRVFTISVGNVLLGQVVIPNNKIPMVNPMMDDMMFDYDQSLSNIANMVLPRL